MERREFISLLGGAVIALPSAAYAQPSALPVIGYLSSKDEAAEAVITAAIRQGLGDAGFVEGKNVAFAYRWSAGDYGRLPQLAADLVAKKVSVIATSGLPATLAAKAATSTIPIVFRLAIDPVEFNLARSLDHPGGNSTGVTMLFDPLTPKKLQLLHELAPTATTIGFLLNPKNQNAVSHREHAERAAATLGIHLVVLTASRPDEMNSVFIDAQRRAVGALLVGDDPLFDVLSRELVDAAARYRLVVMYYVRDFVAAGGLVSYGPSFEEMATHVGAYLGRILQGAKPAELPVQQPTRIDLVINLKTAKALGLTVPPTMLASATEVIE